MLAQFDTSIVKIFNEVSIKFWKYSIIKRCVLSENISFYREKKDNGFDPWFLLLLIFKNLNIINTINTSNTPLREGLL